MKLREASSVVGAEMAKLEEAETRIAAARANLELQRANLKLAELEKTVSENLFQKEVIPRDRYDRAMTAYEVAVAQVKTAEEQLRSAESQKLTQAATIRQKQATAAPRRSQLRVHQDLCARRRLRDEKKSVQTGNQIQPGQPLMAVVALDDIWVTANSKRDPDGEHPSRPDGGSSRWTPIPGPCLPARVDSIMAGTGVTFSLFPSENATGNYVKVVQRIPVKIVLDEGADKDHVLRIGMSVETDGNRKMKPGTSRGLIAFTVMLPTLIEIIDTSIVNVSLNHIRGSLSAGIDESTWTITAYLVSNAIIIPMAGLAQPAYRQGRITSSPPSPCSR